MIFQSCDFYHFGHFWMSHDMTNTKFRNISKIGVWAYFGGPYGHKGMVSQSRDIAGFTPDQWSEGSSEPPSFWVQPQYGQNEENTVFCKLSVGTYNNIF